MERKIIQYCVVFNVCMFIWYGGMCRFRVDNADHCHWEWPTSNKISNFEHNVYLELTSTINNNNNNKMLAKNLVLSRGKLEGKRERMKKFKRKIRSYVWLEVIFYSVSTLQLLLLQQQKSSSRSFIFLNAGIHTHTHTHTSLVRSVVVVDEDRAISSWSLVWKI